MLGLPSSSSSSSSPALTGAFHSGEKNPFCVVLFLFARDGLRGEFSREVDRLFFPVCSSGSSDGGELGGGFPPSGGTGAVKGGG